MANIANEVAERLGVPGASLDITGTVFPKAGGAFAGQGTIRRTDENFILQLTFAPGAEAPQVESGTYGRDDYWKFEGAIAFKLKFVIEHLAPFGPRNWYNGVTTQEYSTNSLSLVPEEHEKLSVKQRCDLLKELELKDKLKNSQLIENENINTLKIPLVENNTNSKPSPYSNGIWIHAIVKSYPLIHKNGGTEYIENNSFLGESPRSASDTFSGKSGDIEFGLIKRGEDLNVYLYLQNLIEEIPIERHEKLLTSFLTGLAFATGQNCWPYRVLIRSSGALLLDKIYATRQPHRTSLAPFSERIGFNAAVGNIEWAFEDFLVNATRFFNSETEMSQAASHALWLMRSADAKDVPKEITLMSLCVLLESLTGMIYDYNKLSSTQDSIAFNAAKSESINWIESKNQTNGSGFQRFLNIIKSAQLDRPKDKYKAVSDHYELKWEGLMLDAWDIWSKVRNKGAHDILKQENNKKIGYQFTAIGRIAGAINVLVLKLIGYSGIARTSVFENKHHKI